jgi:hypothetical protein
MPEAIVNVTKDRLKVAALESCLVVSARKAFQVERNIASAMPPRTAENSIRRKSDVKAGNSRMTDARSDPVSIRSLLPCRSEMMANGMLKRTVVNPKVVKIAPRLVTDMPSKGK